MDNKNNQQDIGEVARIYSSLSEAGKAAFILEFFRIAASPGALSHERHPEPLSSQRGSFAQDKN